MNNCSALVNACHSYKKFSVLSKDHEHLEVADAAAALSMSASGSLPVWNPISLSFLYDTSCSLDFAGH